MHVRKQLIYMVKKALPAEVLFWAIVEVDYSSELYSGTHCT